MLMAVPRHAWNHQTQTTCNIMLPATLDECITHGQSVLIATVQGDLLLWTFSHGVVQVDINTIPLDREENHGPAEHSSVPIPPLTQEDLQLRQATYFLHPRDEQVFFVATYHEMDPDWICVYEFTGKTCSRVFRYSFSCPFEIVTRGSSSWETLGVYHGRLEKSHAHFAAKTADSHGTHVLLGLRGRLDGTYRHIYVTFNTLTKTFSAQMFEPPPGYESLSGEPPLVWNGQLCVNVSHLSTSLPHTFYPSPVLVLQPSRTETPLGGKRTSAQWGVTKPKKAASWKQREDELRLREIQEEMLTSSVMQQPDTHPMFSTPKKDVVRHQDVLRAFPRATDAYSYVSGLLYMFSFYGDQCTSAGPHATNCTRCLPATPSGGTVASSRMESKQLPLNYVSHGGDDVQVRTIFADDDFMVIVPVRGDFYTIFAVDPDRRMAKALIESSDETTKGYTAH